MIKFFKTLAKFFGRDFFNMTYILKENEIELWKSIVNKAECGYKEFLKEFEKDPNYIGWPWVSPGLTKKENEFLETLHYKFFGSNYIVDPIGRTQADYILYEDIKNRIIWKDQ